MLESGNDLKDYCERKVIEGTNKMSVYKLGQKQAGAKDIRRTEGRQGFVDSHAKMCLKRQKAQNRFGQTIENGVLETGPRGTTKKSLSSRENVEK